MSDLKIFSLGSNCALAECLKLSGFRQPSPLDWVRTEFSIANLLYVLKGYFTKDLLERRWVTKTQLPDDNDIYNLHHVVQEMNGHTFYHEDLSKDITYRKVLYRALKLQDYLDHINKVSTHNVLSPLYTEYDNTYMAFLLREKDSISTDKNFIDRVYTSISMHSRPNKLILVSPNKNDLWSNKFKFIHVPYINRYFDLDANNKLIVADKFTTELEELLKNE